MRLAWPALRRRPLPPGPLASILERERREHPHPQPEEVSGHDAAVEASQQSLFDVVDLPYPPRIRVDVNDLLRAITRQRRLPPLGLDVIALLNAGVIGNVKDPDAPVDPPRPADYNGTELLTLLIDRLINPDGPPGPATCPEPEPTPEMGARP
jgi:hypothetical protein